MNTTYHGFDKTSKFSNKVTYTCNGAYAPKTNNVNHYSNGKSIIVDFIKMTVVLAPLVGGMIYAVTNLIH